MPQPSVDAKGAKRYLGKRGKAFASLNAVLKNNVRRSANGRKVVSNATIVYRSEVYTRMINQLYELGYELRDIHNLKPKHIEALMRHWEAQELSASTLQNRFSCMKTLCRWLGKSSMLRNPKSYLMDPSGYGRQYAAEYDHSWSAQGVDAKEKIALIERDDPNVARVLRLQLAFGLRIQEASLLNPARDSVADRYLRVVAGTKGGRPRVVPIETDKQRQVLAEAHQQARRTKRSMIPLEYDLGQWLTHCYYILGRNGISRKAGLVTHGLRHQYANDVYEQLTGSPSPVRGGLGLVDAEHHQQARLDVSSRLGHAREAITEAYYGKNNAVQTHPAQAKKERKQFLAELRVQQQLLVERIKNRVAERQNGCGQVSETTLAMRWRLLNPMVKILLLRGEPLHTPDTLSETHINILLAYWHRSAGITEATARNNVQVLAQLCQWLDKPELASWLRGRWKKLNAGETHVLPCPLSETELAERIERIRQHDPRAAVQIELVRVLGLTHRQAAMLQPIYSYQDDQLDVIWEAPKDQVLRFSITTERQRAVLTQAIELVGETDGQICPPEQGLGNWLQHVYTLLREIGQIGMAGEPTWVELQDPNVPTPTLIPREIWLMRRAGLGGAPKKQHLFRRWK